MGRGNYKGKRGGPLSSMATLCRELCKTAEPIEMPFGLRTQVGPGNYVLDGGPHLPWEETIVSGKGGPV